MILEETQPQQRPAAEATQPAPRVRTVPRPRRSRPPAWLTGIAALLGASVFLCFACSLSLAVLGADRVLALRDQVLGATAEQRVESIRQMVEVVVRGEDAWPVPDRGRLILLLMGVDRRPSQGSAPGRTDAITLIAIDRRARTAALLSVPRDLYVPLAGAGADRVDRINTAYVYGESNRVPGGGAQATIDTLALNLGIPVDRHFVIDFRGFEQAIDALGGIDVNVPRRIVDSQYPTDDFGTELLIIEAGPTHMDGALALQYVRTRHQDSDFGRMQRQQQVILAARDKALSLGGLAHLPDLLDAVTGSYATDLTVAEMAAIAQVWGDIPAENIAVYRIDETMVQPWTTPTGASVLIPNRQAIAPIVRQFLGQARVAATP